MAYLSELRPRHEGRSPTRHVLRRKRDATPTPGPASYSPVDPRAKTTRSGLPFPCKLKEVPPAGTPGPIYSPRTSSFQAQVSGFGRPNAPAYSFPSGRDSLAPGVVSPRGQGSAGPASYSPHVTRRGAPTGLAPPDDPGRMARLANSRPHSGRLQLDEAQLESVGPAAYSPNVDATRKQSAAISFPKTTKASPYHSEMAGHLPTPSPVAYYAPERNRFGRSMGVGGRLAGYTMAGKDHSPRYLSKELAAHLKDTSGPGPGAYTPREMLGVVDLTHSNTSTHAPAYSFGTSTREDPPAPIPRAPASPTARLIASPRSPSRSPSSSKRASLAASPDSKVAGTYRGYNLRFERTLPNTDTETKNML